MVSVKLKSAILLSVIFSAFLPYIYASPKNDLDELYDLKKSLAANLVAIDQMYNVLCCLGPTTIPTTTAISSNKLATSISSSISSTETLLSTSTIISSIGTPPSTSTTISSTDTPPPSSTTISSTTTTETTSPTSTTISSTETTPPTSTPISTTEMILEAWGKRVDESLRSIDVTLLNIDDDLLKNAYRINLDDETEELIKLINEGKSNPESVDESDKDALMALDKTAHNQNNQTALDADKLILEKEDDKKRNEAIIISVSFLVFVIIVIIVIVLILKYYRNQIYKDFKSKQRSTSDLVPVARNDKIGHPGQEEGTGGGITNTSFIHDTNPGKEPSHYTHQYPPSDTRHVTKSPSQRVSELSHHQGQGNEDSPRNVPRRQPYTYTQQGFDPTNARRDLQKPVADSLSKTSKLNKRYTIHT